MAKNDVDPRLLKHLFHADFEKGLLYRKRGCRGNPRGTLQKIHGYRYVRVLGKQRLVHRLLFAMFHGWYPETVDHINMNKEDNRIVNLRACSARENASFYHDIKGRKGWIRKPKQERVWLWRAGINFDGEERRKASKKFCVVMNWLIEQRRIVARAAEKRQDGQLGPTTP